MARSCVGQPLVHLATDDERGGQHATGRPPRPGVATAARERSVTGPTGRAAAAGRAPPSLAVRRVRRHAACLAAVAIGRHAGTGSAARRLAPLRARARTRASARAGRPAAWSGRRREAAARPDRGAELVGARRRSPRGDAATAAAIAVSPGDQPRRAHRARRLPARAARVPRRGPSCSVRSVSDPGRPVGAGARYRVNSGPTPLPRTSRRRRSARRVRVLTVPSGQPSRSAISVCERSSP